MTDAGYVIAGWLIVFGSIGGFALRTLLRGRKLAPQVPPEERRWT